MPVQTDRRRSQPTSAQSQKRPRIRPLGFAGVQVRLVIFYAVVVAVAIAGCNESQELAGHSGASESACPMPGRRILHRRVLSANPAINAPATSRIGTAADFSRTHSRRFGAYGQHVRAGRETPRSRTGRDGLDPRGNVLDGCGRRIDARRQAGPRSDRRRVLDGSDRGDQSPVRASSSPRPVTSPSPNASPIPRTFPTRLRRSSSLARSSSHRRPGEVSLDEPPVLVALRARSQLAASRGAREHDRGQGRLSGRPGLLGRRGRVCPVGRQAAADRGRMGIRRAGPEDAHAIRLGRRAAPGRKMAGQHLAGALPRPEHGGRRLLTNGSGRHLPAQRIRTARHGRERLGVVRRLVSSGL